MATASVKWANMQIPPISRRSELQREFEKTLGPSARNGMKHLGTESPKWPRDYYLLAAIKIITKSSQLTRRVTLNARWMGHGPKARANASAQVIIIFNPHSVTCVRQRGLDRTASRPAASYADADSFHLRASRMNGRPRTVRAMSLSLTHTIYYAKFRETHLIRFSFVCFPTALCMWENANNCTSLREGHIHTSREIQKKKPFPQKLNC